MKLLKLLSFHTRRRAYSSTASALNNFKEQIQGELKVYASYLHFCFDFSDSFLRKFKFINSPSKTQVRGRASAL